DVVGHVLQPGDELATRNEAPVDPVEVAEDGDVQSRTFDRRSERQQREQSRSAQVEREGGPGTLEITRLIGTGPPLASPPSSRLASPKLIGPASLPRSRRVRAPIAWCSCFA